MKLLSTLFITISTAAAAFAQTPDKALAKVRYSFTHMRDTTQKDKPYTENMLLVTGKNASVYTSYDKLNRDLEIQKQIQEQIKNQAGSGQMSLKIERTSSKLTSDVDYFYFAQENKFYTKERLFNNYVIEENAPKIPWKISKDTASFSGIKCQKATAHFKGRNWVAWFAQDLPFQSGPWKLNGLPGLIVEAHDEKKEVQFQFAGMDNVSEEEAKAAEKSEPKINAPGSPSVVKIIGMDGGSPYLGTEIKLPTDAVKTTRKDLDKLKEARDKDPQGFMNAQMAANGAQIGISQRSTMRTTSPSGAPRPVIVINNPIELPEIK